MKRAPWYSTRPGDGVYHNNDSCPDGTTLLEDDFNAHYGAKSTPAE